LSQAPEPEVRFAETHARFSAMQNLITTRSDVFQIIVTVQSGYTEDTDGDGIINYRITGDGAEFIVQSEQKASMVYER